MTKINQSGRSKRNLHEGERDVIRLRTLTEDKRAFRRMLTSADLSLLSTLLPPPYWKARRPSGRGCSKHSPLTSLNLNLTFTLDDHTEKLGTLNNLARNQIHQVCWKASYLSFLLFLKITGMKMTVQNVKIRMLLGMKSKLGISEWVHTISHCISLLSLTSENNPLFLIVLRIFKGNPQIDKFLYVLVKLPHHEAKLMLLHARLVSAGQTS